jgi:hypothetical protein
MLVSVNRVTLAFGCLKSAESLSMLISLPTALTGFIRSKGGSLY